MDVKILLFLNLKVMPLKLVRHTLQKNLSRDVKRNNLVPERKLNSFVQQRVKKNVRRSHDHHCYQQQLNVVHVKIRIHSNLQAIPQGHVIHMLQKNPTRDVERNNLVPERKLNSFVQQPVDTNAR